MQFGCCFVICQVLCNFAKNFSLSFSNRRPKKEKGLFSKLIIKRECNTYSLIFNCRLDTYLEGTYSNMVVRAE